mmetsp:Transcript_76110/g.204243  ORF Transcript_76110/g.204243 Transcript_76110/m.204243 type:complete len:271 (-) Transcript_76110:202-1014(-)
MGNSDSDVYPDVHLVISFGHLSRRHHRSHPRQPPLRAPRRVSLHIRRVLRIPFAPDGPRHAARLLLLADTRLHPVFRAGRRRPHRHGQPPPRHLRAARPPFPRARPLAPSHRQQPQCLRRLRQRIPSRCGGPTCPTAAPLRRGHAIRRRRDGVAGIAGLRCRCGGHASHGVPEPQRERGHAGGVVRCLPGPSGRVPGALRPGARPRPPPRAGLRRQLRRHARQHRLQILLRGDGALVDKREAGAGVGQQQRVGVDRHGHGACPISPPVPD